MCAVSTSTSIFYGRNSKRAYQIEEALCQTYQTINRSSTLANSRTLKKPFHGTETCHCSIMHCILQINILRKKKRKHIPTKITDRKFQYLRVPATGPPSYCITPVKVPPRFLLTIDTIDRPNFLMKNFTL